MKYKICTLLIICFIAINAFAQNTNVFLIGHSQTNFTMPKYMASLAEQAAHDYTFQAQITNGSTLKYQWENSASAQGSDGRIELPKGEFDVLFLNDNRPFQSVQAEENSIIYGNLWWDLALSKPSVRVILQPYWPWKSNDPYYDPDPSWEQVVADRRVIYERIAKGMEQEHPGRKVYISPIDMAVVNLVRKVERGEVAPYTSRDDIYGDEVHLTDVGKYLNALVNYAVVYRSSPVGLSNKMYNEWGSLMIEIPESAAKIFQEVAWQACLDWSRSGVTEETQPPTAPTNLVSTGNTANSVSLSWNASTDNGSLTGYDIYEGTKRVGSSSSTSYTVTGLVGSTSYTFKVVAKDISGNVSAASNSVSVTTGKVEGDPAPTAPTDLVATEINPKSVSLSWIESTDNTGVIGYDIYRGTTLAGSTTSATSFTAAGLSPETSYTFTVKAKDEAGNVSEASNELIVTTPAEDLTAPSTPTNLTSTGKTSGSVSLAWDASTDNVGVSGYNIYRGSTLEGTTSSTSYVALGLAAGTSYTFTVRARDESGNLSPASNSVTVTTYPAVTYEAEDATINGAVVATNNAGYTGTGFVDFGSASGEYIEWTVSAETAGSHFFDVRYANGGSNNRPLAVIVNGTTVNSSLAFNPTSSWTSWSSTNFTANLNAGSNTVRIQITDTAGPNIDHLKVSEEGEIADPIPPSAPTNLVSTGKTTNSVSLSWGGSSDNVSIAGYNIYRGTTLAGTSQATSYTVTGLSAGTSYTFTVKAKDPSGNLSDASNALTETTDPGSGTIYEAENATLSGPLVATNHGGYTGTGFADFGSTVGEYIEWNVSAASAGTHTLDIRYANGGTADRPLSVSVNGTTVNSALAFNPTGAWDAWSTTSVTSNLNSGSNTVRVTLTQSDGPNVDHLNISADTDTEAPTTPTNLTSTGKTSSSVSLSWTGSTDNVGVSGYNVYTGTTLAGTSTGTTYTVSGLSASTSYTFTVRAKDAAGNLSDASNALTESTDSGLGNIYEAENATLSGPLVATNHGGYTGSGFADFGSTVGEYIEWSVSAASAGTHTFEIRYANGGTADRTLSVSVNGTTVNSALAFNPTGDWATWSTISFTTNLNSGSNTVRVTLQEGSGPNVDHLDVQAPITPTNYEAEDATLSGPTVATNHEGYTGTGFADFGTTVGEYIEWNVSAASSGTHTFDIRYANGGTADRPLSVSINGTTVNSALAFNPTGDWATWSTTSFTASFNSGSNTVRVTLPQASAPNVDHLKVVAGTSAAMRTQNNQTLAAASTQALSVHPNPATEYVNIQFSARKAHVVKYQLSNLMGQVLSGNQYVEAGSNSVSINVSSFSEGIYLLYLDIDGRKLVKKIIVRK